MSSISNYSPIENLKAIKKIIFEVLQKQPGLRSQRKGNNRKELTSVSAFLLGCLLILGVEQEMRIWAESCSQGTDD